MNGVGKKIGISIPVANEENSIADFLNSLAAHFAPMEKDYSFSVYIVMDAFSKDRTFEIVKERSERDPRIRLVFFRNSSGVVSCYLEGFKCALKDGCDYIIEMDSGGSHPSSKLKDIIFALDKENYDIVFMSRFIKGGGVINFPLYRRIVSKGGSILANLWLGTNYSDATSGYQAFKASVLKTFNLDAFISKGGIYQTEMKYYCKGFKIKEIPFTYIGSTTAFKPKFLLFALKTLFKMKHNMKCVVD